MAVPRTVIRLLFPPLAATLLLLAGPGAPGPASEVVGHAQLVSSSPGAGQVLDEAPVELRLIFSEPPDPRHSSLDLLNAAGEPILSAVGGADPEDRYALVAQPPTLENGSYMVVWRALSTADGHTTSGFFTFGVGAPAQGMGTHDMESGAQPDEELAMGRLHPGHTPTDAAIEVVARVMGYLGFMLAFGLALIMVTVLMPVSRQWPTPLVVLQGLLLAAAAVGAFVLTVIVSRGPQLDLATYFLETRTGNLLLGRILLGGAGAIAVLAIIRFSRPPAAVAVGGASALLGLVLMVLGGHSAAHAAIAPTLAMLVHVSSASVWIAGLSLLIIVAVFARRPRFHSLALCVPRFSALALVSVGLLAMSGVYIAWVETRDFTAIDSDYSRALATKIVLALAAFSLGGLAFIEGGRRSIWPVGFRPRIVLEGALAVSVLVSTANLASGAPPASERPVPIAPTAGSLAGAREVQLEIQPGRPGPNRYWAVAKGIAAPNQEVELVLERLDRLSGATRIPLEPWAADPQRYVAEGGLLPRDSTWDASVVISEADREVARSRFVFGLDDVGIDEGHRAADINPALLVAIALIAGGLLSLAYVLAGGLIPRVERSLGRRAVIAGALIGGVLGFIMLAGGPRL
jgi:copper transport protein